MNCRARGVDYAASQTIRPHLQRTRAIAPTVASTSFLTRTVKAIEPLRKSDDHRAALTALCGDLAKLKPKDKRLRAALTKIGGPK